MRSLRFKVLLLATLLVAISQVGTISTVLVTADHDLTDRAHARLERGGEQLARLRAAREAGIVRSARIMANDPALRRAVAAGDTATVTTTLAGLQRSIGAGVAMLLGADGKILAATRTLYPERLAFPGLVHDSGEAGQGSVIRADDGIYEMITVPLWRNGDAAFVTMGFALDDDVARQLSDLSGLDVTLYSIANNEPAMLGSSMDRTKTQPNRLLQRLNQPPGGSTIVGLDQTDYLALTTRFIPGSTNVMASLTIPLDDAMAPYRLLRLTAILFGLLALLLAIFGASRLSHTITEPLRQLQQAARRIRAGQYSHAVELTGNHEIGDLVRAFNSMQQGIAEREERISYQALYDSLTGLPNRTLALQRLDDSLERARQDGSCVSLLLVGLVSFDEIGSSLGHDIGDALLAQAAERLRASLGQEQGLARLDGNDFLIVLEDHDPHAAAQIAHELLRLLRGGLSVRDVNISLNARIGICAYPEHGNQPDQLLLRAAVAKNDARTAHEAVRIYQEGRDQKNMRQLAILGDLRRAVRHDELKLWLQPKIALADGRVCGAEALVRWEHPTLGFLPPQDFIPIAEQSGNISLITDWALTAAIREGRLLQECGLDLSVSVNISGRDLTEPQLTDRIIDLLRDHDFAPHHLMLEITEQALVHDLEYATRMLNRLRGLGVRISIDDFGTGYSSLTQLKHLPVDEIKIDRSFVLDLPANPEDVAIVSAAIELAHNMGLETLAEGVESDRALSWLRERGCEQAQGYLFSQPIPAERMYDWIRAYESGIVPGSPADDQASGTSRLSGVVRVTSS